MKLSKTKVVGLVLYAVLAAAMLFSFAHTPFDQIVVGDAAGYHFGAANLVSRGMFSLDGSTPYTDREPGYSFFLAPLYAVFGPNVFVAFVAQVILYAVAALVFLHEWKRVSPKTHRLLTLILFLSPVVLKSHFLLYRESFVLSAMLFLSALLLSIEANPKWWKIWVSGFLLSFIVFAYFTFVLLPIVLVIYLLWKRVSFSKVAVFLILSSVFPILWGFRNFSLDGHFRMTDPNRSTIMTYVRGEQAREMQGLEPLKCLYAEYVSRDFTGLSKSCSFTGIQHRVFPTRAESNDANYAELGREWIAKHPFNYAWLSLVSVIEFHFPYVGGGGWSFAFNVLIAAWTFLMYLGFLLAMPKIFKAMFLLPWTLVAYDVVIHGLTYGMPRYLVPISFCYAIFAAVGYARRRTHAS